MRAAAATALGQLDQAGFRSVTELVAALKDMDGATRAAAAEALGRFTRLDAEIARDGLPALTACLRDAEAPVRSHAAFAIGRMGIAGGGAADDLGAALASEKSVAVRKELIRALGSVGPQSAGSVAKLLDALTDSNLEIRQAAALALGSVPLEPTAALPPLRKAARDADRTVRCHAIHAIGKMGKGAVPAVPDLVAIMQQDTVAEVRLAAIEELAAIGPDAKDALEALKVASKDGRPAIREAAQEAVKKIQPEP